MSEHIPAFSYHDLKSAIRFSGSIFYYCEIWTQTSSNYYQIKEQITFGATKCSASKPQINNVHNST